MSFQRGAVRRRWLPLVPPTAAIAIGFLLRWAHYRQGYVHPDEVITVEVVRHLQQSGGWDTNWAKADLPLDFSYDQYNFSSYLLAAHLFSAALKVIPGGAGFEAANNGLFACRLLSVLLSGAVLWLTWRLARRVSGDGAACIAVTLTAAMMLLVQDAHYARPEAFTTLLTVLAASLSLPETSNRPSRVFTAATLIGLLIACKVSMVALVWLPAIPLLAGWRESSRRSRWLMGGAVPLGLAVGFALGAPGAVAHPSSFFNGIQHLTTQYAGTHPPHGHMDSGPVLDLMGTYFLETLGWLSVAAFGLGSVWLVAQRRWTTIAVLVGPVILFACYFATQRTFFERNLSHVLPLFAVVAALGITAAARWSGERLHLPTALAAAVVTALTIIPSASVTKRLVGTEFSGRGPLERQQVEETIRSRYSDAEFRSEPLLNPAPLERLEGHFRQSSKPILLRVLDYDDEWTARYIQLLKMRFATEAIAEFPGTFPDLSVSTLKTYHSPHERYFLVKRMSDG